MRARLSFVFWCAVALFLLFAPFWLFLSKGSAQDAGAPEGVVISSPEDMNNPATGEAGTWIPRWVERESIITEHKLQMCMKDTELADRDILALRDKAESLEATVADLEHAKDELLVETYGLEQSKTLADKRLERRLRAIWGLVGSSIVLAGGTIAALLR